MGCAAILLIAAAACGDLGCTPQQKGPAVATAVDSVLCVLNHISEPPEQIVKSCIGVTIEDVGRIIAAHRAAEVREGLVIKP
jgi:hypothetical protein